MDRHAAKGFQPGQNENFSDQIPQAVNSELTPPFSETPSAAIIGGHHHTQTQFVSPEAQAQSPYTPVSITTSSGIRYNYSTDMTSASHGPYQRADAQLSGLGQNTNQETLPPYNNKLTSPPGPGAKQYCHGQMQQAMPSQPSTFTSQPQSLHLDMSHTQYPSSNRGSTSHASGQECDGRESTQYHDASHHPADIFDLDQMTTLSAGPVFGGDGGLSKTPYVAMPEDFMAYLFNSLPSQGSSPGNGLQGPISK